MLMIRSGLCQWPGTMSPAVILSALENGHHYSDTVVLQMV
jgi:hypothetical protein